jgi:alpha-glucosidase
MDMQVGFVNKLDVPLLRELIGQAEFDLDNGQPLFVFDNHDNIRSWDRYGDGVHNLSIARLLAPILFCTRATAMMYYGQEIGMETTPPTRVEDVKDPIGKIGWPKQKGRDGERTPMQWNASQNAGFTLASATPWLPIPPSYKTVNVSVESQEKDSLLNWYKRLIFLRKTNPALHDGSLAMLDITNNSVLSWLRQSPKTPPVIVVCNFTDQPQNVAFDLSSQRVQARHLKTLAKTPGSADPASLGSIELPPFGVYIGEVQ